MDLKNCYKILEIQQNASLTEIKQAYRDMIGIWHPDRYAQNPRLQKKATEKLKELNIAYKELVNGRTSGIARSDAGPGTTINETRQTRHNTHKKTDDPMHTRDPADRTCAEKSFSGQSSSHDAAAFRQSFSKRKRRFLNKWTMLLSIIFMGILITNAGDIRHLLGQGLEQIFRGRYAHFFKGPFQTTPTGKMTATASDEILQLQRSLKKFGYSTLPLDGIWGEQTLTAVQQFRDDYFLELRVDDITEITRALQRQRAIITLHPDWPRIAKDPRFRLWTEQQIMTSPKICRELLASGEIHQVGALIEWYKFGRLQPKPVPMPRNGILNKSYHKGLAPITIQTRNDGLHYYLKLLNTSNGSETLSAFLRSGSMLVEQVPVGKYELKYAVGDTWYGTRWLFGPKTIFRNMDQVFEFKIHNNEISGYRLDLYLRPTGSAGAGKDYAFDF